MKKIIMIGLILMHINCKNQTEAPTQFIEFIHTGQTTHSYPILLISSKKVNIKLSNEQLAQLKSMIRDSGAITNKDKELFIKITYRSVVTDRNTFTTINNFVADHVEFYSSLEYLKHHPQKESFDILVNGKERLFVNEKLKNRFVNELILALKANKSNGNIIKEISYLRQDD